MKDKIRNSLRRLIIVLAIVAVTSFVTYRIIDLSNKQAEEEQAKQDFKDECDDLYAKFTNTEDLTQAVYNVSRGTVTDLYDKSKNSPTDDLDSLKEYVAKCVKPNY